MHLSRQTILAVAAIATALSGCSTRPRNFAAEVSTPVPDRIAFENDYRTCQQLVATGHSSGFKAAAATGAAGVAGTFGTTAAFATAGGIGIGGATTAASVAIPGVGLLAAFGVNRAIRGGKERKLKRNMSACLGEYGYEVADWEKLDKKADSAAAAASRVTIAASVPAEGEPVPVAQTGEAEPVDTPVEFALMQPSD